MRSTRLATQAPWLPTPTRLELTWNTVHLWRASLAVSPLVFAQLAPTLAPDEQARAARFVYSEDRIRFIAGRGILRTILGRYLDCAPAHIRFDYGIYGKPALAEPAQRSGITFSVAHSGDLALYSIAVGRAVGVDVEAIRTIKDGRAVAAVAFSPLEQAALAALPEDRWLQGFFRCWTRKEAYVKARGLGLSLPLDRFDVSLMPNDPPRLLRVQGEPVEAARWVLHEVVPAPGYLGAVAVEGDGWQLIHLDWQPDVALATAEQ